MSDNPPSQPPSSSQDVTPPTAPQSPSSAPNPPGQSTAPESPVPTPVSPAPNPSVSGQDVTHPTAPESSATAPIPPAPKAAEPAPAEQPAETQMGNPVSAQVVAEMKAPLANVPWTLQQFFNGEIDLDVELVRRFPNMPLMSSIQLRNLGTKAHRGVATLSSLDGAAMVLVDASAASRSLQFSFTFGSMLTLRFNMDHLSDMDRTRWLELMRRERGGLAFLWGQSRWKSDYIICISRRYFTSLLAFSPNNFEAAVRMTPDVNKQLLAWLETFWKPPELDKPADQPPPLLTW